LGQHGIADVGGRELPDWSARAALALMDEIGTTTAMLSVSAPGTTFLDDPDQAAALARELNEYGRSLAAEHPARFGYFATLPLPHTAHSAAEAEHALDTLRADGVVLLANSRGSYLGSPGQDELFAALDQRHAVAFVHPASLPGEAVEGIPPFATDFLLDTTRAAYLLVRNGIVRRYPNIRFVLSHAGGFVPYAAHRMATAIVADTGASPLDVLDDLRGFYFDTALSGSPAALPSLLAFARPGNVLFGSDWPFAPPVAVHYFTAGLDNHPADAATHDAIDHRNAERLFPRLAGHPRSRPTPSLLATARTKIKRSVIRRAVRMLNPAGTA
jgi:predicted TIM-barrel fold metal-dependent hydrolase